MRWNNREEISVQGADFIQQRSRKDERISAQDVLPLILPRLAMIPFIRLLVLVGLLLVVSTPAQSEPAAVKRPITHNDYASWRSLQGQTLSPDGNHVAYAVAPQEGAGELVVRNLLTSKEYRHPRGSRMATPFASTQARGKRGGATTRSESSFAFSPDSKHLVFLIYPSRPDQGKGKSASSGGGSTALGILDLHSGKLTTIDRVRSFQVPEDGPPLVVYHRGTGSSEPASPRDPSKGALPKGPPSRTPGELVLRRLTDGKERTLADVSEYTLTRDGNLLVYTVTGKKEELNGLFALTPGEEAPPFAIRSGAGRYQGLAWDDKQSQLVFFHSKPTSGSATSSPAEVKICHWKRPDRLSTARLVLPLLTQPGALAVALQAGTARGAVDLIPAGKSEVKTGLVINELEGLQFSDDGRCVYYSVQPAPTPTKSSGRGTVNVELWHYNDDYIQPIQKVRYNPRPSYRVVFHLEDRICRQLSDESLAQVQPAPRGDWVLGVDERPYRRLVGSEEAAALADCYLIQSKTGEKKLLAKKQPSPPSFSPGGKYLLSFDGKDWHSISLAEGKQVNLTQKLGVSFVNELHDQPSRAPSFGFAGWTQGDTHVLLYDRYDIWMVAADGSSAENVTRGLGRKTTTQLRVVRLETRERAFDPNKPLLVRGENESTRDTGFYRVSLGGTEPTLLIMGARNYGTPQKARKGDRLLFTISTFYDFPDLYTSDLDFREVKRVTDVNPQKASLLWGKAELVKYRSADGQPLQGVLIKPENFDPSKKYPLLVYIYERLSQNLHRFVTPQPGTSINPTYYASNGYLVLMPDIAYTVGYPGQSAVKCVLPAIQAVVDQGCVDEKAIGIQGHSWGGYQTAYLVTQTTRFKAAAAGAPVANMTSAYGGIRWGSGLPRQFQYEKTQSRIGGTLWQYLPRFVENSPLFYADRVKTPLLMLHNDRDGAVPWQQGIEYYLALRRLGKEVYLFNYPGEMHGLRQRANQRDYTVRMQEFFDHHLKGAPKPEWMVKGQPYAPPPGGTEGVPGRRGRFGGGSTTSEPEE